MKILAIDTSTEACSAALYSDGELVERYLLAPRKHIELLQPMVAEVMAEADVKVSDLTGLAFGAGPGVLQAYAFLVRLFKEWVWL